MSLQAIIFQNYCHSP